MIRASVQTWGGLEAQSPLQFHALTHFTVKIVVYKADEVSMPSVSCDQVSGVNFLFTIEAQEPYVLICVKQFHRHNLNLHEIRVLNMSFKCVQAYSVNNMCTSNLSLKTPYRSTPLPICFSRVYFRDLVAWDKNVLLLFKHHKMMKRSIGF